MTSSFEMGNSTLTDLKSEFDREFETGEGIAEDIEADFTIPGTIMCCTIFC